MACLQHGDCCNAEVTRTNACMAQVEPRPGGKFAIFGGSVEAIFTALEAPKQLALDWRFKSWPDGALSKARRATPVPHPSRLLLAPCKTQCDAQVLCICKIA